MLFLASFHNNDATLSQFHVLNMLCESFIETLVRRAPPQHLLAPHALPLRGCGAPPRAGTRTQAVAGRGIAGTRARC